MKKILILSAPLLLLMFIFPFVGQAATLELSPSSGTYEPGSIFTVNIMIDTQGQASDGIDIKYLNYNPAYLEIQDEDAGTTGTQINAGSLFSSAQINSVDTANGQISFSQVALGGTTFTSTGQNVLATMRFKVLQAGNQAVTFDHTPGNTLDTNVAGGGLDLLTSVTNGSYTLQDNSAPSAVTSLATSDVTTSSVKLSWTAPGDNGNSGTASSYDIRYSTSNITSANWSNATPVVGEPSPSIAGTLESMTISSLSTNTTYYFAIKTSDEVPNVSAISNVVNANTQLSTLFVALSASTLSGTAPLNNINLTATISGTQTGSINYTFYCDRSDVGTNITTPYDAKFDNQNQTTYIASNICSYSSPGTYSAKVITERGSNATEDRVVITVSPVSNIKFVPRLEGLSNTQAKNIALTLLKTGSQIQVANFSGQVNAQGEIIPSLNDISSLAIGNYDVIVNTGSYLRKKQSNVSIASNTTITLPTLRAGDINDDGIINSLDWSVMNSQWFTANVTSDINKDGIVNSLDFSWLNGNWLQVND